MYVMREENFYDYAVIEKYFPVGVTVIIFK